MTSQIFEHDTYDDDIHMSDGLYSGLYIDVENNIQILNQLKIIENLHNFSNKCRELSLGVEQNFVGGNPFPNNNKGNKQKHGIIIVLPTSRINNYMNINNEINLSFNINDNSRGFKSFFDDFKHGTVFKESLGHCYITWDTKQNICGIWDVCLHRPAARGLGSKLMEAILDILSVNLPDDTILWLGIDMRAKIFDTVASLYAKFGFKSPLISGKDPFGNDWNQSLPYGFLSMVRNNDYIDPSDINRDSVMTHIKYIRRNFLNINRHIIGNIITDIDQDDDTYMDINYRTSSCTLNMIFNKSFAKWLKRLSLSASSLNEDGTVTQKEVSSSFFLDNPKEDKDGQIIWEIVRDIKGNKNIGQEESVWIDEARYNFHTHPREAYLSHKVKVGYPSAQDYITFVKMAVYDKNKTIFHCVITVEGIYTISIAEFGVANFTKLQEFILKDNGVGITQFINKNLDINKDEVQNNIQTKQADKKVGIYYEVQSNNQIKQAGKNYSDYVNNMRILNDENSIDQPLFHVSFNTWDDIIKGEVISIYYPSLYNQCFIKQKTIKNYEKLNDIQQPYQGPKGDQGEVDNQGSTGDELQDDDSDDDDSDDDSDVDSVDSVDLIPFDDDDDDDIQYSNENSPFYTK